jgi:glyoxylase-like metal-dependent hydrolase (beta-lactamase superfamily II)
MAGIRPRDVDTVVVTHAHPDHIGGALDARGRAAFPMAEYVISEFEHEFWTGRRPDVDALLVPDAVKGYMTANARECLEPLDGQIELVYRETEIAPGVRVIPAPGHTPGHLALLIVSEGEGLLNIGDAAVHPLHLEQPEWANGFDLAGDRAIATRRALMERAVAENMRVMAFHFPFPSVGRVAAREEGGWSWTPGVN